MKGILIIASIATLLCTTSCETIKHEEHQEAKFLVTSPVKKDTAVFHEYVCQIRSIQHIEVRALERGYLQEIYVDEGQLVKKGQLMFKIMPIIYQAEMQRAQAEASFANIEYQNTKSLADDNIVSPSELALAKAKLDKARAELALAQAHLTFTEVKAPFDGIMDRFHVRLGSLIDEGELLTTLSDNSKMWVYFNVPEAEYLDYIMAQKDDNKLKVRLLMANNREFNQVGIVETIEADFNNETGNIAFRATFPNPKGILRHGETGNILMDIPLDNVVLVPQKATFEILDKRFVFVVDKNNVIHQREITIGEEMQDLFVVKNGVKEGEKILLEGLRKVKDGDKIEVDYVDPTEVISHLKLYAE